MDDILGTNVGCNKTQDSNTLGEIQPVFQATRFAYFEYDDSSVPPLCTASKEARDSSGRAEPVACAAWVPGVSRVEGFRGL